MWGRGMEGAHMMRPVILLGVSLVLMAPSAHAQSPDPAPQPDATQPDPAPGAEPPQRSATPVVDAASPVATATPPVATATPPVATATPPPPAAVTPQAPARARPAPRPRHRQQPKPTATPAQQPAPPTGVERLPRALFLSLPSPKRPAGPRAEPARRNDSLMVGSALAMLAVAASTLLLLAQATRVRRELTTG